MNSNIVHISLGCNLISNDGAEILFETLKKQNSIVSIDMANIDCYKNKNKIGSKGSAILGELLATNHLISMVNLTDNALS